MKNTIKTLTIICNILIILIILSFIYGLICLYVNVWDYDIDNRIDKTIALTGVTLFILLIIIGAIRENLKEDNSKYKTR